MLAIQSDIGLNKVASKEIKFQDIATTFCHKLAAVYNNILCIYMIYFYVEVDYGKIDIAVLFFIVQGNNLLIVEVFYMFFFFF